MSRYEHMGSFPPADWAEDDDDDDEDSVIARRAITFLSVIGILNLGLGLGLGYLIWS